MIRLARTPEARVAIRVLASDCDAPENHVMKITPTLARAGLVRSVRGRIGGLLLARSPDDIWLGEIVRITEPGFSRAPEATGTPRCANRLADAVAAAADAYLDALNHYRLSDMLPPAPVRDSPSASQDLSILNPVS